MGIRSRLGVHDVVGNGAFAAISGIFRTVASIRLPNLRECISVDMLKFDYLPYEATQTYRQIMVEFDYRRASAVFDAQQRLRTI